MWYAYADRDCTIMSQREPLTDRAWSDVIAVFYCKEDALNFATCRSSVIWR